MKTGDLCYSGHEACVSAKLLNCLELIFNDNSLKNEHKIRLRAFERSKDCVVTDIMISIDDDVKFVPVDKFVNHIESLFKSPTLGRRKRNNTPMA